MYDEIDALELEKLIKSNKEIEIIDVREDEEWDMIRIPNTKLIPLSNIVSRVDEIDFSKKVYIFCRSGYRSWQVCAWLDSKWKKATNVAWSIRQLYREKSDLIEITDKFYPWYF